MGDPLRRRAIIALAVLAGLGLLGGYGFAVRARPKATKVSLGASESGPSATPRRIFVHVGGAVKRPGVYHLRDGSRVTTAIVAAGGATSDADLDSLNLAAKIKDGDKVLVPKRGSAEPQHGGGGTATTAGGASGGAIATKINLNTAQLADLETLPGIGPSIAQRIIDYRQSNGGFSRVEDLLEVPGIGPKKFEELKDRVTV